ncbi:TetR/AcrR family transcriptional regulator [Actinomadura madurae]|nr:TetR/AcrR family transcriptional regulator [Actinomadura madurae]
MAATGDIEVASVARRAGVSVGLPYRYFGTRSGLLSALITDFYDRLDAAVGLTEFDGDTWQDRERARVHAWVDHLYGDPLAPMVLGGSVGTPKRRASRCSACSEPSNWELAMWRADSATAIYPVAVIRRCSWPPYWAAYTWPLPWR